MSLFTKCYNTYIILGAYVLDYDERFGISGGDPVIGEVHCVGDEPEMLECSHTSIGKHDCGDDSEESFDPDVILSCYGGCIQKQNSSKLIHFLCQLMG